MNVLWLQVSTTQGEKPHVSVIACAPACAAATVTVCFNMLPMLPICDTNDMVKVQINTAQDLTNTNITYDMDIILLGR